MKGVRRRRYADRRGHIGRAWPRKLEVVQVKFTLLSFAGYSCPMCTLPCGIVHTTSDIRPADRERAGGCGTLSVRMSTTRVHVCSAVFADHSKHGPWYSIKRSYAYFLIECDAIMPNHGCAVPRLSTLGHCQKLHKKRRVFSISNQQNELDLTQKKNGGPTDHHHLCHSHIKHGGSG